MADFFMTLIRSLFMVLAGVLVLVVAGVLLLFTIAFMVVAIVWGLINGRKPSASASWSRFQRSAASAMWQRYRNQASRSGQTASEPSQRGGADVVDVDFREVPTRPAPRLDSHHPANP